MNTVLGNIQVTVAPAVSHLTYYPSNTAWLMEITSDIFYVMALVHPVLA